MTKAAMALLAMAVEAFLHLAERLGRTLQPATILCLNIPNPFNVEWADCSWACRLGELYQYLQSHQVLYFAC